MNIARTLSSPADSSAPETAPLALKQDPINPGLTLALAQASLAAYYDYEQNPQHPVVPPVNFRVVARWTGWDGSWVFGGQEERYGLVFRSTLPGQEGTFIFAFRGTDSDMDIWEDVWFDTVPFAPYRGNVSPTPYVSSGFYSVYDTKGDSMPLSMRQQVFALLGRFQPKKVHITGHSLGAALSQLFTLDMAVSTPNIPAVNLNFASPMVGTSAWQIAYDSQPAQKDPFTRTVRVYNYYDWVPSLPPSIFNYTPVGRGFRTAFYVPGQPWRVLDRHALLNLQTVLQNAVWRKPQVWVGQFPDSVNPQLTMQSDVPPGGAEVRWIDKMLEFQQFEQSLREGGPTFSEALESMARQEQTA